MIRIIPLILICISFLTYADYPTSFSNAKSKAERAVYFDRLTTFYCDCDYVFDDVDDKDGDGNTHETMIHPESCGYTPRNPVTSSGKDNARISRIEWEHIMPAHVIGGHINEWKNKTSFPDCKKSNGKFISGRDCAYKLNPAFKRAHNDMHNLTPAVGELNGDRSNYPFRNIIGEKRVYGACDFEIDLETHTAEPPDSVKGNIARVYFYMIQTHGAVVSNGDLAMFNFWDKLDPVDAWECKRNERIKIEQGNGNHFVSDQCH